MTGPALESPAWVLRQIRFPLPISHLALGSGGKDLASPYSECLPPNPQKCKMWGSKAECVPPAAAGSQGKSGPEAEVRRPICYSQICQPGNSLLQPLGRGRSEGPSRSQERPTQWRPPPHRNIKQGGRKFPVRGAVLGALIILLSVLNTNGEGGF